MRESKVSLNSYYPFKREMHRSIRRELGGLGVELRETTLPTEGENLLVCAFNIMGGMIYVGGGVIYKGRDIGKTTLPKEEGNLFVCAFNI